MDAKYGHFTAMQVRDRKVRGLDLHLARLRGSTRELFGVELDTGLVLASIATALDLEPGLRDSSVRVYVVRTDRLHLLVTARPPREVATAPRSVEPVVYQRFLPHIKHLGGFPQGYFLLQAEANGHDEALFTTPDGTISEGAITNVGCFDGTRVLWPDAPMLRGITMQLMQRGLDRLGVPQLHRAIRVGDLQNFETVFLSNSHGVVAVGRVGEVPLKVREDVMAELAGAYTSAPWDSL